MLAASQYEYQQHVVDSLVIVPTAVLSAVLGVSSASAVMMAAAPATRSSSINRTSSELSSNPAVI